MRKRDRARFLQGNTPPTEPYTSPPDSADGATCTSGITTSPKPLLMDQLRGYVLPMSFQACGCLVIQKALEDVDMDQKIQLESELEGHVARCIFDYNASHVIRKCLEHIPAQNIGFIIKAFKGRIAVFSVIPHSSLVVQWAIEHCYNELQTLDIVGQILNVSFDLVCDQCGSFITQVCCISYFSQLRVLERCNSSEKSLIISKFIEEVVSLSTDKYASHVIQTGLMGIGTEPLIEKIISQSDDILLVMMMSPYAHYVIEKILEVGSDRHKNALLRLMKLHLSTLTAHRIAKRVVVKSTRMGLLS